MEKSGGGKNGVKNAVHAEIRGGDDGGAVHCCFTRQKSPGLTNNLIGHCK